MALPKKGSRRIVVDGAGYRWRVSSRHWCCSYEATTLGYAVEDAAAPGATLVVETGRPLVHEPSPEAAEPILPGEVAAGIRAARARGWTPTAQGPSFRLRLPAVGERG
ncbi:hypothetical protein [Kitasatospora sp. NPDC088134]|uniref:hypothetical protein n=1 Tax=Kitasatospora sp. NPDC088134 TaxID=3364071 RepID=UPI00380B4443